LDWYLAIRGHTLSTAHLTGAEQLVAEARYVLGEAGELRDAVAVYWHAALEAKVDEGHRSDVRAEIADVVLSATALAGFLGVSVEECIAEKTEADRGRG
jgi:NTP pyrophosphatase (non-canonical NTP hydrolase)